MTTNQTIGGVPREQIVRALEAIDQVGYQDKFIDYGLVREVKQELRALLDSPAPVPTPAAWMRFDQDQKAVFTRGKRTKDSEPLYPHPTAYRVPAAQPQGAPVHLVRSHGSSCWEEMSGESLEMCKAQPDEYEVRKLYAEQPAPVAVVMPERLDLPHRDEFESADQYAAAVGEAKKWNACLDEVTRLNSTRPTHANPPPGTEPSGTHHDNDGLDEWRKPE